MSSQEDGTSRNPPPEWISRSNVDSAITGDAAPSSPWGSAAGYREDLSRQAEDDNQGVLDYALFDAELMRETGGALSAPPPPGFEGPEERSRLAHELFFNTQQDDRVSSSDGSTVGTFRKQGATFTNLASVLGSGLVESMNDATLEHNFHDVNDRIRGLPLTETMFDPMQDLSYARQYRHAASRLIGTSPPKAELSFARMPGYGRQEPPSSLLQPLGMSTPQRASGRKGEIGNYSLPTTTKPRVGGGRYGNDFLQPDDFQSVGGPIHPANRRRETGPRLSSLFEDDSRLPSTKDVGLTVMEPTDLFGRPGTNALGGSLFAQRPRGTGTGSNRSDDGSLTTSELEHHHHHHHGIQHYPMGGSGSRQPQVRSNRSPPPENDYNSSQHNRSNHMLSEAELQPFLWEPRQGEPSRCLVIIRAPSLHVPDVRSTCEAFGVLETFRADFADRGIFFVGYYDIRSAQYAALELQSCLNGMLSPEGSEKDVLVFYCVPLNSSTQQDESVLVLTGIPQDENDESVLSMLSAYGSVRSLTRQGGSYGGSSFVAEFHDVQDAKQALLELETTQPWGSDVAVEVGTRSPVDRKRGRELLALIGRWRQSRTTHRRVSDQAEGLVGSGGPRSIRGPPPAAASSTSSSAPSAAAPSDRDIHGDSSGRPQQTTQLVLGPDGRYSYMVVNHYGNPPPFAGHPPPPVPQHVVHLPHQQYATLVSVPPGSSHPGQQQQYWSHQAPQYHPYLPPGATVISSQTYSTDSHGHPSFPSPNATPFYGHAGRADPNAPGNHVASPPPPTTPAAAPPSKNALPEDKDNRHLALDLDGVESGLDTRTSLMVRNIPNKYTQQMLLAEFAENGHGPGKIDFFYLPIDFKNRCNRGYAFINFVDYRDILPFHRQYYGKHWRAFNSDKICDVTYARIQGKAGMLKRFENSALMEKDEEYKPLVFVSHGEKKGERIPFPTKGAGGGGGGDASN